MAAECSLGGALAPVMEMLSERSCRACPTHVAEAKGTCDLHPHCWVLSHGNLSALRCFVNALLAAAVLMEEGTDCLAQLVKRASLCWFFSS